MKCYKQVHLIVKDRGFVYEPINATLRQEARE